MKQFILWTLAVVIMFSAIIYQRQTGPTYPISGHLTTDSQTHKYKLLRSHETTSGAIIELPNTGTETFTANLHYKRFQTADSLTVLPFTLRETSYGAMLPVQPAAGKMEYYITGTIDNKTFRIPNEGQENIVLRYKDPVPIRVLLPHVILMFFAVLFGLRAGLSAIADTRTMRKWIYICLAGMTLGGMVMGPIVQKYAFGEFWTGFPYGSDFTDNKTLIMWVVWLISLSIIGLKAKRKENINRAIVLIATVVMMLAYIVPHSMGGSTLDYDKVDQGIDPKEAIETGE